MIAIITSTIYPHSLIKAQTWNVGKERIQETLETIESLQKICGIKEIYLADNSGQEHVEELRVAFPSVIVHSFDHVHTHNKGIAELNLLLMLMNAISENTPILKISGRYQITRNICDAINGFEFAALWYRSGRQDAISTRCYLVKDKTFYEKFLMDTLREMHAYSARIVGPRSLIRILKNSLYPANDDYKYESPAFTIEAAAANVLTRFDHKIRKMEILGITGFSSGNRNCPLVE